MPDPKRLDLAHWTPAGFVSCNPDEPLRAAIPEAADYWPDPGRPLRAVILNALGFEDFARLVILRAGAEAVTLATLHRADFLAPQWTVLSAPPRPSPAQMLRDIVRGYREGNETLCDTLTLDATTPGWREGDVVAVVGTDREGGVSR